MSTSTKKHRLFRVLVNGQPASLSNNFAQLPVVAPFHEVGDRLAVFKTEVGANNAIQRTLQAAERVRASHIRDFAGFKPLLEAAKAIPVVQPFESDEPFRE